MFVDISDESRAGWEAFRREHGVTLAAAVEAVGLSIGGMPPQLAGEIGDIARQVAAERRSRRR